MVKRAVTSCLADFAKRVVAPFLSEKSKRRIKAELFQVPDIEYSLIRMKRLGFRPSVAIDVGAYVGDWTRIFKRVFPDASVLMIEPQQSKIPALTRVTSELSNVELRSALLGGEPQASVGFCESETASSVLTEAANRLPPTTHMEMTTLDVMTQDGLFARPDFIKLDVQGYEIEVLRGAVRTLESTEAVLVEVNLLRLHQGAPLFHESAEYMGQCGFQVYDVCSLIRRPFDGAIWQADVIFVRSSSLLVASNRWS
jgi:FkbM family methyltransferase